MTFSRTTAFARAVAFVALVGAACSRPQTLAAQHSRSEAGAAAPVPAGPPMVHASGLVLDPQPAAFIVKETAAGFRIEPGDARRMRSPWSIQLGLADADPAAGPGNASMKLGEREARYRVTVDEEAGSGGPLHVLTARLACGDRWIVMTATQQLEPPAKPDWSIAWTAMQTSRCPSAPRR
jgi:hypothetical protein